MITLTGWCCFPPSASWVVLCFFLSLAGWCYILPPPAGGVVTGESVLGSGSPALFGIVVLWPVQFLSNAVCLSFLNVDGSMPVRQQLLAASLLLRARLLLQART